MPLSLYDLSNDKASKQLAGPLNDGLMSKNDKSKLDSLQNYEHPSNHPASMITGLTTVATTGNYADLINKPTIPTTLPANGGNADTVDSKHASDFATSTHIHPAATITTDGLMVAADKIKLDNIAAEATKVAAGTNGNITINGVSTLVYTHPSNHDATMITQNSSNRFVTDTQISTWNAKATTNIVTTSTNGLMISTDKIKINKVEPELSIIKSNKDTNKIYVRIDYKRKSDNTLFMSSVLSGGTSPRYTTRTETYYDTDGTTIISTKTYTISYDTDGDILSEI